MMNSIILHGMEFYAYHGCFKEEKIIGTHFKVDATLNVNLLPAAQSDDLSKTINYQVVYAIIHKVMLQPSNLLETICLNIINALKNAFPSLNSCKITVYKLNPSIGGKTDYVAVSMEENF